MTYDTIEGRNPVLEALRAERPINKIFLAKGGGEHTWQEIINLAKVRNVPIQWLAKQQLEEKALTKAHQGIIALASPINYVSIEEIIANAKQKGEDPFIVILDHLEDPHNLGAILRTADAVGVHGVIIPSRRGVSVNSTVAKTSAGAVEYVPVAKVTNLVKCIESLKELGCWVVGLEADAEKMFSTANLYGPLAVVIGSEGKGISRLVKENCDFTVKIPMKGQLNSLNASAAAAVMFYEIFRQRKYK
ncbi:23S rRNA (guanosine(2251)-2'-O)-methyltransferase RlmB [Bacillota bacterium LX-D]|nr:23S rRNA (guanosine(2251)-2'-O)-methyltransferase RlmB [Bacillota bacterium LX-D]